MPYSRLRSWLQLTGHADFWHPTGSVSTDDPRQSQQLQMVELEAVLDFIYDDLNMLARVSVPPSYTSASEQNKQISDKLRNVDTVLSKSNEAVLAALDALVAKNEGEWLFLARSKLRNAAIASLTELAKHFRALGKTYLGIARNVSMDNEKRAGSTMAESGS